jgi:hypothetical protein
MMRRACYSLIGLLGLCLGGCGPADAVWVTLDLKKGGQPLVAPETQSIQVTFYGMERKNPVPGRDFGHEPFAARKTGEATYELPGPEGYGIPAGKYRVAVVQTPRPGTLPRQKSKGRTPANAPDRDEDFLKNRFGPDSSPIIRTVEGSCHLTIDLDNPSEQPSPSS